MRNCASEVWSFGPSRNDGAHGRSKNKIIFRWRACPSCLCVLNNHHPGRPPMAQRQLKLGAFMRPVSLHTGAWRYPGAWPDANFNFQHLKTMARKLEAGKFDAFFMADHLAVLNMPVNALKRSHTVTSFEPFTLLSALAGATEHIGLIATGSTTFDAPYHVARRFASLDHIS